MVRHRSKDDRGTAIPTAAPAETSIFLSSSEFRRRCGHVGGYRPRRSFVNSYYKITGLSSITAQSSMK
jgi:hypothetical protein